MDAIDREILHELQLSGRESATTLSQRVGLTVAPTLRRMKDLEASGVIRGYHADVNPERVGLSFEAIVFVQMNLTDGATIREFERQVDEQPQVVEGQRLFGDIDYLLRVLAPDLMSYQRFFDEVLTGLPGVRKITSTIVMKTLKAPIVVPV